MDSDSSQGSSSGETPAEFIARLGGGVVRAIAEAIPPAVVQGFRRLSAALADPEIQKLIVENVQAFVRLIEEELDRYETDPRAIFYNEMLVGQAVLLMGNQREGDDTLLFDALEASLISTPLTEEARAAVRDAPYLSSDQRERMLTGFDLLEQRRWVLACDLLLRGFEGALWDTATARGVIDERRYLTALPQPRKAKGPNSLIGENGLEDLRPAFGRFVDREIFGATGHDLRHGRGDGDRRAFALLSAVAILGWLDHFAETGLMAELGGRLDDCVDAYAGATAA